jgi:hypothetical protein
MLAAPASSLADNSLTLSVSSDPVVGLPIQYAVSATTSAPDDAGYELWVLIRPASLGPCGSDEYLDPSQRDNEVLMLGGQQIDLAAGQTFSGSWTIPANLRGTGVDTTTSPPGPYLACGWIDDQQTFAPVATATVPFSLRAPRDTMTVSAPSQPRLRHQGTFSVRGVSEAPAHVTVEVLPTCLSLRNTPAGVRCAGRFVRGCQANPEAESNYIEEHTDLDIQAVSLISREIPRGRFNLQRTVTFGGGWIPARHMVCAWIGPTSSDRNPNSNVYLVKSAIVDPRP